MVNNLTLIKYNNQTKQLQASCTLQVLTTNTMETVHNHDNDTTIVVHYHTNIKI